MQDIGLQFVRRTSQFIERKRTFTQPQVAIHFSTKGADAVYPNEIFLGMTLYDIFLLVGVLAAFVLGDRLGIRRGFSVALQKTVVVGAFCAVTVGYGFAVLFQAFYNFMDGGAFEITQGTGATFFGGLLGGAGVFLLIWFVFAPKFCKDKEEPKKRFSDILDIAAVCVPIAHAFGRIGCFFAGCCHGAETDGWWGVAMNGGRYVPVQLYESTFLFALGGALLWLFFKGTDDRRIPLMPLYALTYGVWRFFIEYARADERGATVVSFLSPSQLVAVLLVIFGAVYFVLFYRARKIKMQEKKEWKE